MQAASLRTLVLGWSFFLLSSLLIFSISLHIHLLSGSEEGGTFQVLLPPSSPILPALSRVLLTGEGLEEESLKVEDLLWVFYWSLLVLPCLLFFSLLLALVELLTYCSHHQRWVNQSQICLLHFLPQEGRSEPVDNYGDLHQVGHEAHEEGGRGDGGGGGESVLPASLPVPSDGGGGCEEGSLGERGGGEKTLVFFCLQPV